jgi:hypothetical protein
MPRRVLHLVDADAGWWSLHAAGVLSRCRPGHRVLLVGGSRLDRLAPGAGLTSWDRVGSPQGLIAPSTRAVGRFISHIGGVDGVHAWSARMLKVADAARTRLRVTGTLSLGPARLTSLDRRALVRLLGRGGVMFSSGHVRDGWRAALGGDVDGVIAALPVEGEAADSSAVKASWGIDPGMRVLAGIGEPDGNLDARALTYQAGVMMFTGVPTATVSAAGARDLERAARFIERHQPHWPMVLEPRPIWRWLNGCDAAMWVGDRWRDAGVASRRPATGVHGVAWAAWLGVPIVAEDRAEVREVVGDEGALFAPARDQLAMNRAVLRVLEDRAGNRERSAAARARVARTHSAERFAEAMTALLDSAG